MIFSKPTPAKMVIPDTLYMSPSENELSHNTLQACDSLASVILLQSQAPIIPWSDTQFITIVSFENPFYWKFPLPFSYHCTNILCWFLSNYDPPAATLSKIKDRPGIPVRQHYCTSCNEDRDVFLRALIKRGTPWSSYSAWATANSIQPLRKIWYSYFPTRWFYSSQAYPLPNSEIIRCLNSTNLERIASTNKMSRLSMSHCEQDPTHLITISSNIARQSL